MPLCAVSDRLPSRRLGAVGALQLAVRAQHRGGVPAADRGHRRRAQPPRADRQHPRHAALARHRVGRRAGAPVGPGRARRGPRAAAAQRLAEAGRAYWCECTREDIERRAAERGKPVQGYDGFCRDRGLEPGPGRALRFRRPLDAEVTWPDVVRGAMQIQTNALDDFVIVRSNGTPLFIVANTVDDAEMDITHVIRGEDHLTNTPKYLLLWEALEFGPPPPFAHLPLLVNEQRKKLSKRRDDVSVADYKARVFLGPAMRNYLALLGWAPPDEVEVRPIEEIVALFRLEDVNPSPAFFDVQKLTFVNG